MSDNNYKSYADVSDIVVRDLVVDPRLEGLDPASYDDLLKFSNAVSISIENLVVDGNGEQRENAIDMNRNCMSISIKNARLVSGWQNAITIKGGCVSIHLENVEIVPGHGHCDIELGNWSDQSQFKTRGVSLKNVWRSDGEPVRLRVGNAEYPVITNCDIEYLWFQSLLLKAYVAIKRLFK